VESCENRRHLEGVYGALRENPRGGSGTSDEEIDKKSSKAPDGAPTMVVSAGNSEFVRRGIQLLT